MQKATMPRIGARTYRSGRFRPRRVIRVTGSIALEEVNMCLGNTVMQLAGSFKERLLRHHQDNAREWDLLEQERHKERIRIARELHDTLLQTFFSASMRLCLADECLPGDSAAKPMLRRALDLLRKGLNEGRA